eukprot:7137921-Pyramimonas_sp.AAC.1
MPPQAFIHGGQINGVQVGAMTFVLHSLSERYGPLGEETRMKASKALLRFQAEPREKIDDLLTRFDIVRHRAEHEGGLGINIQTTAEILLQACMLSEEQLLRLLEPTNGLTPSTEQQYVELCTRLRRMGHIVEGSPDNIVSQLRNDRGRSHTYFGAQGANPPRAQHEQQDEPNMTYMMNGS